MKKIVGLALVSLMISGCGSASYLINPKYKSEVIKNSRIYIESVKRDQIRIEIPKHFKDDFQPKDGDDHQQILADCVNSVILVPFKELKGENIIVNKKIPFHDSDYFEVEKSIDAGTKDEKAFRFKIPKQAALERNSVRSDYAVVMKDLVFDTHTSSGTMGSPTGSMGSTSSKSINLDLRFIMWDYGKNDVVSFGFASGSASAKYFVIKTDWISIIDLSGSSIINKSPLKNLVPEVENH